MDQYLQKRRFGLLTLPGKEPWPAELLVEDKGIQNG